MSARGRTGKSRVAPLQLCVSAKRRFTHAVQFARPDVAIEFDTDQQQAVATRRSTMQAMAESKSLVAGMHLPFPGIGHVRADGKDSCRWVPIEFAPLPELAKQ